MTILYEFYGHDAFKITSPAGLTVLTDPWRNDSTGLYPKWFLNEFPSIRVDIVLSTHAHFDHDAVDRPSGLVVLELLVGQFRLGDVQVVGLADKHKCESTPDHDSDSTSTTRVETCPPNNVIEFDNAIQIIETGGLRIATARTRSERTAKDSKRPKKMKKPRQAPPASGWASRSLQGSLQQHHSSE